MQTQLTPCIEHTGSVTKEGYGFWHADGTTHVRHRYEYQKAYGTIPDGMVVRHKCHNKLCYNLEHLELGTQKQNVHDSVRIGKYNKKLTDADAISIRAEWNGPYKEPSQKALAAKYGCSVMTISDIVNRRTRNVPHD